MTSPSVPSVPPVPPVRLAAHVPHASPVSPMERMSANPWFGALPLADREALLASAEVLRLRPGEMLFRQGDAPGGFYGLLGGLLKISSLREDGREAILVV